MASKKSPLAIRHCQEQTRLMERWMEAVRNLSLVATKNAPGTIEEAKRAGNKAREAYERHVRMHGCSDPRDP
jgi:hypothetical protein